jgi:hypothetical protein
LEDISAFAAEMHERRDALLTEANVRLHDKYERALLRTSSQHKISQKIAAASPADENCADVKPDEYSLSIEKLTKVRDNLRNVIVDELLAHPCPSTELRRARAYLEY